MKTILVPTDFSPLAANALRVAADLARTYGADITLLHYRPFSLANANTPEGGLTMANYLGEQDDEALDALHGLIDNPYYRDLQITPISCRDAGGLYKAITKRGADLLVLGTRGASGWDEWLFGSNAEQVVRRARCPVLVLKEATAPFSPTNAIAAIDVDDALRQHWPAYPFTATGHGLRQFVYVSAPDNPRDPEGVHQWMRELAAEKGLTDYELHVRPARNVETGILNYAREREADLIVLYTHGHTGLRHLLQGSVAEDVLNHAPLPVLVMRIKN